MGDRVNNSIELLRYDKEKLKDFLSDISHQLKTPLASLVMFNDLLRENENMPYEDRVKFLDKSEEQLRRMEWLIMNLLKVGRIEANAIRFEIEKQPLEDTIDLAISSLIEEAKKKDQRLVVEGEVHAEVTHDKEWLAEALSNIVKNSIEHTDIGGEIKIQVYKGPLITKIYIKDSGVGMSEELQKKVFKRFYKGESSSNPKSIGIGLSLSKSIIEEMNGEIKLISEEGKGSTFIISFFS
jgi:signal transduction histidine kinase